MEPALCIGIIYHFTLAARHRESDTGNRVTGGHFTNTFSVTVQIYRLWTFLFALLLNPMKLLVQNFTYDTTAVLSWHAQTFVLMSLKTM